MSTRQAACLVRLCAPTVGSRQRLLTSLCGTRQASTLKMTPKSLKAGAPYDKLEDTVKRSERMFQRLPTATLLRAVFLGQIFKTPFIFKPGLYLLEKIANSNSVLLDADKNPLIRAVLFPLIYKQFCAGRCKTEVQHTIRNIKKMGYSGVILCYSKEVMARTDSKGDQSLDGALSEASRRQEVNAWKDGNLATMNAVGEGDYIGIKYTGAGPSVSQALKEGREPSELVRQALDEICEQAKVQKKRLWIDAEQQIYHPMIDKWTIDLMRKYNRGGQVIVMTTIQSYLKSSRQTVAEYLRLAQKEGWSLGVKLVRGAYIGSDVRSNIHDTKAETDASYDGIAHDIITKAWPGFDETTFPHVRIFLAGHNAESVRRASMVVQQLAQAGKLSEEVHYGQLQGMADDIGCELLALGDQAKQIPSKSALQEELQAIALGTPRAYKCLTWGSVKDCMHYLVRRAVENQGATERMNAGLEEMKKELRKRILKF